MGADQKQESRTPATQEGRGGVWLKDGRLAETGSFKWYLALNDLRLCHPLMGLLIELVQTADDEQRARLALDFPDVVAALEMGDWYKAPAGRAEAWKQDAERLASIIPVAVTELRCLGPCPCWVARSANPCQIGPVLRAHDELKKEGG